MKFDSSFIFKFDVIVVIWLVIFKRSKAFLILGWINNAMAYIWDNVIWPEFYSGQSLSGALLGTTISHKAKLYDQRSRPLYLTTEVTTAEQMTLLWLMANMIFKDNVLYNMYNQGEYYPAACIWLICRRQSEQLLFTTLQMGRWTSRGVPYGTSADCPDQMTAAVTHRLVTSNFPSLLKSHYTSSNFYLLTVESHRDAYSGPWIADIFI